MHPPRPMRLALLFCTLLPLYAKAADTPAPALGATPEKQLVDGTNTYYWDNYTRDGWTLMVRDFERPAGHFVQVKLLAMAKPGTPH